MTDTRSAMRQDVIRRWAREQNLPVGHRGPLPESIVEAYHKEVSNAAVETGSPERQKQAADAATPSFDPLADYLKPRFGDIYAQYDGLRDQWTPELREAVTQYLLHEVPAANFEAISLYHLSYVPTGNTRADQAQSIVEREFPSSIAYALHAVAVEHAPSPDAVLEQDASRIDLKIDCGIWLRENGTYDQLIEVARISGLLRKLEAPEVIPATADELDARFWLTEELLDVLSPKEMADAWHYVTTSTATDLTDEEWSILEPLLPTLGGAKLVSSSTRREVINGLLYLQAHPERRLRLPLVYQRNHRQLGIFARMLASLDGMPGAERISAWLRSELAAPGPAHKEQQP